jgi:lysophospholipase L1-like esterase
MTHALAWFAVGDSFTAGTGDDPRHGGWIARTAAALMRTGKIAAFHNHAERGVRIEHVLERQVPRVDGPARIISAIAGANDILERRCSLPTVTTRGDQLLDWALATADIVLTCTCPDFFARRSAQLSRLSARVETLNQHIAQRSHDMQRLIVIDANTILADPTLWTHDGVHANPGGHEQLAAAATAALLSALRP